MRLVVGAVVLWHAGPGIWSGSAWHAMLYASLSLGALLLTAGLWTPIAGAVVAVYVIFEALMTGEPPVGHLLAATIAVALTMLGPGRLSIDARLFGWRRIDAPAHKNSSSDLRTAR